MDKSSQNAPLGIIRSTAVISLELVALAGSVANVLIQRLLKPADAESTGAQVSKLVIDEWESDLARLNLPTRGELEALNRQIVELDAQIDQLIAARGGTPDAR
jgi:hypothetical protein